MHCARYTHVSWYRSPMTVSHMERSTMRTFQKQFSMAKNLINHSVRLSENRNNEETARFVTGSATNWYIWMLADTTQTQLYIAKIYSKCIKSNTVYTGVMYTCPLENWLPYDYTVRKLCIERSYSPSKILRWSYWRHLTVMFKAMTNAKNVKILLIIKAIINVKSSNYNGAHLIEFEQHERLSKWLKSRSGFVIAVTAAAAAHPPNQTNHISFIFKTVIVSWNYKTKQKKNQTCFSDIVSMIVCYAAEVFQTQADINIEY